MSLPYFSEIILFGSEDRLVSQKAKNFYRTLTDSPFFETTIENEIILSLFVDWLIRKIKMTGSSFEPFPNSYR